MKGGREGKRGGGEEGQGRKEQTKLSAQTTATKVQGANPILNFENYPKILLFPQHFSILFHKFLLTDMLLLRECPLCEF